MSKFIFVTGGVCSSLGKGVSASSLGALLESRGLNVRMIKCDPYINVDAGTMNPYQHGEVYVTDDGSETDLDLGNYARFTTGPLSKANSVTTGQVYQAVIEKERHGRFLGRCVQVIPHITDEIKSRILAVAKAEADTDVVIVEIGGTVGDIESIPFLEAARQMILEAGKGNALSVHLTLIPEVAGGELKTKPTQHSVKAMQEIGIQPDVLICRAPEMLDEATRRKIASFTNVDFDAVFTGIDIRTTIYEIPLIYHQQKVDEVVLRKMNFTCRHARLEAWQRMMERFNAREGVIRVGVVGKYMEHPDAYKSVFEALFHAGLDCGVSVELVRIDSSKLEGEDAEEFLGSGEWGAGNEGTQRDANAPRIAAEYPDSTPDSQNTPPTPFLDAILVPGGFGSRGILGMVRAAAWARKTGTPYFGICLGMQIMVIEWARNVLRWADADSTEFSHDTKHPVISLMEEQVDAVSIGGNYGATMRLGKWDCVAGEGSLLYKAYGMKKIVERHRHRYEFANKYRVEMAGSGLVLAATTPDGSLVECVQWPDHPWGVGVQFHPEFKSRPVASHPLFRSFIAAARDRKYPDRALSISPPAGVPAKQKAHKADGGRK